MRRIGPLHRQPEGPLRTARATRYLSVIVVALVMVVGWKAATRWRTPDGKPADRADGDQGGQPRSLVSDDLTKPARSGARWKAEDDAYLAEHMIDPPEVIAHHLGRTPSAVVLRKATLKREGRG